MKWYANEILFFMYHHDVSVDCRDFVDDIHWSRALLLLPIFIFYRSSSLVFYVSLILLKSLVFVRFVRLHTRYHLRHRFQ